MKKSDVICTGCGAGFRRLELWSQRGEKRRVPMSGLQYLAGGI